MKLFDLELKLPKESDLSISSPIERADLWLVSLYYFVGIGEERHLEIINSEGVTLEMAVQRALGQIKR